MKGNVVKMEVDYSGTVDKKIPECEALAAVCHLIEDAIPQRRFFLLENSSLDII